MNERVSGGAYIEVTEGHRGGGNQDILVQYEFSVPREKDYYLWVRCDSPPPCQRYFNLWIGSRQDKRPRRTPLAFDYAGLWTWWPWGADRNLGKGAAIHLSAGRHFLFLSDVSLGLRIDKFLITDDPDYIPVGPSESYYNGTFESSAVPGGHKWDQVPPNASGWKAEPPDRWTIREDPLSRNHYYFVSESGVSAEAPAVSRIDNLECACFNANLRVLFPESQGPSGSDALFVHGFRPPADFDAVRISPSTVSLLEVRDGRIASEIQAGEFPVLEPGKFHSLSIRRQRDHLAMQLDSTEVLLIRQPYPPSGGVGIGSVSGGAGFDDVVVRPSGKPDASFDFTRPEDPALRDWAILGEGEAHPWSPNTRLQPGDLLVYRTPGWTQSELSVALLPEHTLSILFPYESTDRYLETRVEAGDQPSVEVIRRMEGRVESCGKASFEPPEDRNAPYRLKVQNAQGLVAVFSGDRRLVETNEYTLLAGTVGFGFPRGASLFPIRQVEIRRNETIVENFSSGDLESLPGQWEVRDGSWKVARLFGEESAEDDDQLAAKGPGTVLFGAHSWVQYLLQVNVYMDATSKIGLLGWVDRDNWYELLCGSGEMEIRKIVAGNCVSLGKSRVPNFSEGWHRVAFTLGDGNLVAEIDGQEVLRATCPPSKGRAGLRNFGDIAAFDNLTVHVIQEQQDESGAVQNVDPLLLDIQRSLFQ